MQTTSPSSATPEKVAIDTRTIAVKDPDEPELKKAKLLSPSEQMMIHLYDQVVNKILVDVDLVAEGNETISVHRSVLAGASKVLERIFLDDKTVGRVLMENGRIEAIKDLVQFIYLNKLDETEEGTLIELVSVSDQFGLIKLKELCESKLVQKLSTKNAVQLFKISEDFSAQKLKKASINYIISHGRDVHDSDEYKKLGSKYKDLLCDAFLDPDKESKKFWKLF